MATFCLDCGIRCEGSRCPQHQRNHRAKYGSIHQALRRGWTPIVLRGEAICSRCHQPIAPDAQWDLDHLQGGERPAHAACNRRAGGQRLG